MRDVLLFNRTTTRVSHSISSPEEGRKQIVERKDVTEEIKKKVNDSEETEEINPCHAE